VNSVSLPPIPPDTAKVARTVLDGNNFYLAVGNQVDRLFSGLVQKSPTQANQTSFRISALLYLITIFQFYETLSDDLAVEAVRKRVDWKYALHLPLNNPGIQAWSLCEFRQWLLVDPTGKLNLTTLISRLSEGMSLNVKQRSNLETDQIIMQVCLLTRLARIWDTFHQSIEALAAQRPEWLHNVSLPHWYVRYSHQWRNLNLTGGPQEQETFAQLIGADGFYLLNAISEANAVNLAGLPEVLAMKKIWFEQYEYAGGKILWRRVCKSCS
jgi:transposase